MEIVLKGIDFVDHFARDLQNRLNGELKDLPGIISQMGICGEQIAIVFHGIAYGEDYFTVSVMDDPQNPKNFTCSMRTGSMIDPYHGFSCNDGNTTKEFSWDEKEKKLEIICEYSLSGKDKGFRVFEDGEPIEISDEQEEIAKKFLDKIYSEQDDTWKNHMKKVWKETRRLKDTILKGECDCLADNYSPGDIAP